MCVWGLFFVTLQRRKERKSKGSSPPQRSLFAKDWKIQVYNEFSSLPAKSYSALGLKNRISIITFFSFQERSTNSTIQNGSRSIKIRNRWLYNINEDLGRILHKKPTHAVISQVLLSHLVLDVRTRIADRHTFHPQNVEANKLIQLKIWPEQELFIANSLNKMGIK